MMAYMGTVIVILLNILVAQMSTTYSQAKKVARLEYDVDRILQLTRMERFPFLVSKHKYLHSSENWGIILPIAELFLHLFFWAEFAREVLPRRRLDQWNETRTRSGKKDLTARTCFTICCNLRKKIFLILFLISILFWEAEGNLPLSWFVREKGKHNFQ